MASLPSSWRSQNKRKLSTFLLQRIPDIAVSLLSNLLGLSRKSIYTKQSSGKQMKEEVLKEQILSVLQFHPSYGHRRIALELGLGKKKIRRVMKQYGIKPYESKARWRKRCDERRAPQPYPNLIKGSCPLKPGTVVVGDFTHLTYQSKIVYVVTYMDL